LRMLASTDPPARAGAAAACRLLAGQGGTSIWDTVASLALADADLSVRLACRDDPDITGATFWSCPGCAGVNDLAAPRCMSCRRAKVMQVRGLPRATPSPPGNPVL
jgi:hypothetical protein